MIHLKQTFIIVKKIQHERRDVPESMPGPTCLANTLRQLTGIHIPTWRLVSLCVRMCCIACACMLTSTCMRAESQKVFVF